MRIIRQIAIIFGICWASQIIEAAVPIVLPANVIGMILLFLLLAVKLLRPEHIKESTDLLLGNMSVLFVPAAAGIMNCWEELQRNLIALVVISLVSLVVTFWVTAASVTLVVKLMGRGNPDG